MKVSLSIPKLSAHISKFKILGAAKKKAVGVHVIRTAFNIQYNAKGIQTSHVDTGRLRDSIDMSTTMDTKDIMEAKVSSDVEYAGHHEAQFPYLSPAAEMERDAFVSGLKEIMSF